VNVVGWYNKHNVGDESYKFAFGKVFPNANLFFSTFPRRTEDGRIPHATILGGGDVMSSEMLRKLQNADGKKYIVSTSASRSDHAKEEFDGVEAVIIRDRASSKILSDIGVDHHRLPDIAYSLSADAVKGKDDVDALFKQNKRDRYDNLVTVIINGHFLAERDIHRSLAFEKLAHDLAYVADFTRASFLFLPFGCSEPWDDRVAGGYVASKAKWYKKNVCMYDKVDPQRALNLISASDAVISSRLHSSIFSLVSGVPFVDVTHNHKNKAMLEDCGLEHWSEPFMSFDRERCKNILNDFLSHKSHREIALKIGVENGQALRKVEEYVHLD
jgi:polysaccharide pyruvyl transferase WcaK-like protein